MTYNRAIAFDAINWLILDVDGVLTDGSVILGPDGTEHKRFNLQDGHGIRMWKRAGCDVALISGRSSEATLVRAQQLEIEHVFQGPHYKLPVLQAFLEKQQLDPTQVAYVGDDLMDLPPVRHVGFGVAVADAVDELKAHADYITTRPGGTGAVREVIDLILKESGRWEALMERYLV